MGQEQPVNHLNPWAVKDALSEQGVLASLSLVSDWDEEERQLAIECAHLLPVMGTDEEVAGVLAQIKYERRRMPLGQSPPLVPDA